MPKISRGECLINRVISGWALAKPGFLGKHNPSLMGETEQYCYYADGPCGFQMDMHDARMVGTHANVEDFVDEELSYSRSERLTLLS